MKIRGQQVYTLAEHIQRKTNIDLITGCWNWLGSTRNGYGRLTIGSRQSGKRRSVSAHRVSYEALVGVIPDGLEVCHKCDNRRCCRPDHLFVGTRQDNVNDREAKGRNRPPRGEKVGSAKLTASRVYAMRMLRDNGLSFSQIAKFAGVNKKTALQAVKGESWSHLPPPPEKTA